MSQIDYPDHRIRRHGDSSGASPVELSCNHQADYTPRPFVGDTVWCRHCKDYRQASTGKRRKAGQ